MHTLKLHAKVLKKAACASSVKPMGLRYFGVVLSLRDGVVGI